MSNTKTDTVVAGEDVGVSMEMSLKESKGALAVAADNQSVADQKRVKELMAQLDITDSNSVLIFGVEAQAGLSEQSDAMLKGVRNKDTGPAGEVMNGLMVSVRGLGLNDLDPNEKRGFIAKLFGKLAPVQKFIQQYESIESQVDAMVAKLKSEKTTLSRDIIMLDGMYNEALKFFNQLALYIEAGELVMARIQEIDLPAAQKLAEEGGMLEAQALRDLNERALDLERKVHDLMLTRQATMQMLPQLRMIQDVDKGLVTKIQSSILTTIPLWKGQIAMAITLWRQASAVKTTKAVGDATNEMLAANSKMMRQNSSAARKEMERGVVDIETLKQVNEDLIATIVEAGQIAEEGKKARIAAQADMVKCENDLKTALKDSGANALSSAA